MNFTREPIIETVITPREGCKLVVRSSKGASQEDYIVDAIEVVSFGHSFFFRSQERPKSFLVPVSDYEILETKEARMVLKNTAADQTIKIGGGRGPSPDDAIASESRPAPDRPEHRDRKREGGKRRRDRRGRDRHASQQEPRHEHPQSHEAPPAPEERASERESFPDDVIEPPKAPSFISKLFPPPQTLIKETLSRYKPVEEDTDSSEGKKEDLDDDNEE